MLGITGQGDPFNPVLLEPGEDTELTLLVINGRDKSQTNGVKVILYSPWPHLGFVPEIVYDESITLAAKKRTTIKITIPGPNVPFGSFAVIAETTNKKGTRTRQRNIQGSFLVWDRP
tara:strand:+ start:17313 stop:17663 length:351 start_codon:yes stop_codon:yes gene_type:complete